MIDAGAIHKDQLLKHGATMYETLKLVGHESNSCKLQLEKVAKTLEIPRRVQTEITKLQASQVKARVEAMRQKENLVQFVVKGEFLDILPGEVKNSLPIDARIKFWNVEIDLDKGTKMKQESIVDDSFVLVLQLMLQVFVFHSVSDGLIELVTEI